MSSKFGPAYKQLREKRGFSVKEAAGDIMTPAALRKFESGENSTSVDNFMKLLLSIGVDWSDFFQISEIPTPTSLVNELLTEFEVLLYKGDFHKINDLIKSARGRCPEFPIFDLFSEAYIEILASKRLNGQIPFDKTKYQGLVEHIQKVETFCGLEFSILGLPELFTPKFNSFQINHLLDQFEKKPPHNRDNWASFLALAISHVAYFSKAGEFDYANQLVERLENLISQDIYIGYLDQKLMLLAYKAANLVRQNKVEGLEFAKSVVKFDIAIGEQLYSPLQLHSMNAYIDLIHSINKTGVPFKPFDD